MKFYVISMCWEKKIILDQAPLENALPLLYIPAVIIKNSIGKTKL